MNVKKIKNIKSLINIQLEYLDNLSKEKSLIGSDFYNPDKAGFFRVSLEIQKQISKLKKER